jgi:hypothetical protein
MTLKETRTIGNLELNFTLEDEKIFTINGYEFTKRRLALLLKCLGYENIDLQIENVEFFRTCVITILKHCNTSKKDKQEFIETFKDSLTWNEKELQRLEIIFSHCFLIDPDSFIGDFTLREERMDKNLDISKINGSEFVYVRSIELYMN